MGGVRREKGLLKLVHPGGFVEVRRNTVAAARIMEKNPRHCVTRPDVFRFPWIVVSPDSLLRPGHVFYIVPNRTIRHLLCRLDGTPPTRSPGPAPSSCTSPSRPSIALLHQQQQRRHASGGHQYYLAHQQQPQPSPWAAAENCCRFYWSDRPFFTIDPQESSSQRSAPHHATAFGGGGGVGEATCSAMPTSTAMNNWARQLSLLGDGDSSIRDAGHATGCCGRINNTSNVCGTPPLQPKSCLKKPDGTTDQRPGRHSRRVRFVLPEGGHAGDTNDDGDLHHYFGGIGLG